MKGLAFTVPYQAQCDILGETASAKYLSRLQSVQNSGWFGPMKAAVFGLMYCLNLAISLAGKSTASTLAVLPGLGKSPRSGSFHTSGSRRRPGTPCKMSQRFTGLIKDMSSRLGIGLAKSLGLKPAMMVLAYLLLHPVRRILIQTRDQLGVLLLDPAAHRLFF